MDNTIFSKTVYKAYEHAMAANMPVKNTVAPIPAYLDDSVWQFFKICLFAPEQSQKNEVILFKSEEIVVRYFEFFCQQLCHVLEVMEINRLINGCVHL